MKIKLICIFSVLTMFTVGTYLYFANDLFTKDKTASIYESTLKRAEFLSKQFENFIDTNYQQSIIYSTLYKGKIENLKIAAALNLDLLSFHFFEKDEEDRGAGFDYYNKNALNLHFEGNDTDITEYKSEVLTKIIKSNKTSLNSVRLILIETTSQFKTPTVALMTRNDKHQIFLSILSIKKLNDLFDESDAYENLLIDSHQNVILPLSKTNVDRVLVKNLWKSNKKNIPQGTNEVMDASGKIFLSSYNFIKEFKYLIISKIAKDKVFLALRTLLKKSIVLGLILICVSVVVSIFFSMGVTRPIKKLLKITRKISEGVYDYEVKVSGQNEFSELGEAFNIMSSEISTLLVSKEKIISQLEHAKAKVERYSHNLAAMVELRTNNLKETNDFMDTMLNSLGQGLMVFNRNGEIHDFFTKVCDQIFQQSPRGKNNITNVLEIADVKMFEKWKSNLFKEMIPFEHLTALGPQFYTNKLPEQDPRFKYISLEYYPMRGENKKVENIVCVATDKTGEYIAKKAFKEQENYTNMITKVVLGKGQFAIFIKEFKNLMKSTTDQVSRSNLDIDTLLRNFHTIKGGASLFSLVALVDSAHEAESFLVDHRKDFRDSNKKIQDELVNKVNAISRSFKEVIVELREYIGEELEDGHKRVEIKYPTLVSFQQQLIKKGLEDLAASFQNDFLMEPVVRYFKGYNSLLQDIAKKLGKHVNPIIFEDNGVRVFAEEFNEFFTVLVHVFRNMIDHGIEMPDQRTIRGKSKVGNVLIRFGKTIFNEKTSLIVQIQDDGQGIDPEVIRNKLKEMGYDETVLMEKDESIVYHIFDENFSSLSEVTDLSGRGVGMSAVKKVIEKQGGAINLRTVKGKGVSFNFCINGTVTESQA